MAPSSINPRQRHEISYFVNARQKTYLPFTEVYIPDKPYEKLSEGYELSEVKSIMGTPISTPEEEKLERSTRRARIALKDIVLTNLFELFVTFTFSTNRFDADQCRDGLNNWLKSERKKDKAFQYAVVPEMHKSCEECTNAKAERCLHDDRPKALHFHVLLNAYAGEVVRAINKKTGKPLVKHGRKVFDIPSYKLGNCDVYKIGDTDNDRLKMAFYLLKYISKEMPTFKNKKRYWASRGLKRPMVIENPEEWYLAVTPDHVIKSDYGTFMYFDNKRIDIFLP